MLSEINFIIENSNEMYMYIYSDSVDVFMAMYFSRELAERFVYDNEEVICFWQQKLNSEESKLKRKKIVASSLYRKLSSEFENIIFNNSVSSDNDLHKISMMQFIDLYCEEEKLRNKIQSGEFVYADGYVCANSGQYLVRKNGKKSLSDYGTKHKDKCCMSFVDTGESGKCTKVLYSIPSIIKEEVDEIEEKISKTEKSYAIRAKVSLAQFLNDIKTEKKLLIKNISMDSFVSERTIKRMLNPDETGRKDLETLLGVACGFQLTVAEVNELVRIGGYSIRKYVPEELAFEACFAFCESEDLVVINAALAMRNYPVWGKRQTFESKIKKFLK